MAVRLALQGEDTGSPVLGFWSWNRVGGRAPCMLVRGEAGWLPPGRGQACVRAARTRGGSVCRGPRSEVGAGRCVTASDGHTTACRTRCPQLTAEGTSAPTSACRRALWTYGIVKMTFRPKPRCLYSPYIKTEPVGLGTQLRERYGQVPEGCWPSEPRFPAHPGARGLDASVCVSCSPCPLPSSRPSTCNAHPSCFLPSPVPTTFKSPSP